MSNLQNDALQLERLKLKLAINRYLRSWGKQYAVTIGHKLRCDNLELFSAVVDEMESEGLLTKETGRNGALIIVRCEASHA